ncbi:uncharacterized protein BDV14DRAFT_173214 [Aspergillus stella-maris]|uniref:uncharacterized protein n=1 Tax=Aspergillus stella-maris TaxID=1810926 RepID=UPI003CCD4803
MSQQHGVSSSLASIEAAPPTHGTETTSTSLPQPLPHPSIPSTSTSNSDRSSTAPQSSDPGQSKTISSRVHIPKLSAATTELLARFASDVRRTTQQPGVPLRNDQSSVSWNHYPSVANWGAQNTSSRRVDNMKVSSCFIELPTVPFGSQTRAQERPLAPAPVAAPVPSTGTVNGALINGHGLASIAPKPTGVTPVPVGSQLPVNNLPAHGYRPPPASSINGTTPKPHVASTITPQTSVPCSAPIAAPPKPQLPAAAPSAHQHQPPLSSSSNSTVAEPRAPVSLVPKPTVASTIPSVSAVPQPTNIQVPLTSQAAAPLPAPLALVPSSRAPLVLKLSKAALSRPSLHIKVSSTTRQRRSFGTSGSRKRKRGRGSDGEDIIRAVDSSSDESDFAPTATQTKSGRQVNRPSLYVPSPLSPALPNQGSHATSDKAQESRSRKRAPRKGKTTNIICFYCQRGHSPPSNTIVFCDRCNRAWHQHCHDPPIGKDVVTIAEKEWICRECKPVSNPNSYPTVVRSHPSLTTKPPVHAPLVIPKAEVGGANYSTDDRRRFLSTLSHAALVELLLGISEKHPEVPMFPTNMPTLPSSKFAVSRTITTAENPNPASASKSSLSTPNLTSSDQNTNTSAASNGNGTTQPPTIPTAERIRRRYEESSDDSSDSEYEVQEHRLYPRAGNGILLSNDQEDLDIMQEDPECTTFSHALHKSGPGPVSVSAPAPAPAASISVSVGGH